MINSPDESCQHNFFESIYKLAWFPYFFVFLIFFPSLSELLNGVNSEFDEFDHKTSPSKLVSPN